MNSGEWLFYGFLFVLFVVFPVFEVVQLVRRALGNESARTFSAYLIHKAKTGHWFFKWFTLIFPLIIFCVSIWLVFHFEGLCINFGWFCWVNV